MTPEQERNVEAWVAALESGTYQQARACLRDDRAHHCCLGVACDISGLGTWSGAGMYLVNGIDTGTSLPPKSVRNHYGLCHSGGTFRWSALPKALQDEIEASARAVGRKAEGTGYCDLVALNDNGVPFALIAKVIRARPEGLFKEV